MTFTVTVKDYQNGEMLIREVYDRDYVKSTVTELLHMAKDCFEFSDNLKVEIKED